MNAYGARLIYRNRMEVTTADAKKLVNLYFKKE
jgi:hypothetical protein